MRSIGNGRGPPCSIAGAAGGKAGAALDHVQAVAVGHPLGPDVGGAVVDGVARITQVAQTVTEHE